MTSPSDPSPPDAHVPEEKVRQKLVLLTMQLETMMAKAVASEHVWVWRDLAREYAVLVADIEEVRLSESLARQQAEHARDTAYGVRDLAVQMRETVEVKCQQAERQMELLQAENALLRRSLTVLAKD